MHAWIVGMELPHIGDASDLTRARQELDLSESSCFYPFWSRSRIHAWSLLLQEF